MMIESCGVGSCSKVRFNFDHVHLSEPIVEACSEVKTGRFFEWSKLILLILILILIRSIVLIESFLVYLLFVRTIDV